MASKKTTIDWSRIEIEYLAGEYSIREIADRFEISDAAIRKHAKLHGWVKPVRTANRREPGRAPPPPPRRDPQAPVDAAAIADTGRGLVARMLDELDAVTSRPEELEDLIIAATEGEDDEARRTAMLRATSLPSRAGTAKTLALALKTLNEASAPASKKQAQRDKAKAIGDGSRFAGLGPPTLKAVG